MINTNIYWALLWFALFLPMRRRRLFPHFGFLHGFNTWTFPPQLSSNMAAHSFWRFPCNWSCKWQCISQKMSKGNGQAQPADWELGKTLFTVDRFSNLISRTRVYNKQLLWKTFVQALSSSFLYLSTKSGARILRVWTSHLKHFKVPVSQSKENH